MISLIGSLIISAGILFAVYSLGFYKGFKRSLRMTGMTDNQIKGYWDAL
jgi:hypothetical protein